MHLLPEVVHTFHYLILVKFTISDKAVCCYRDITTQTVSKSLALSVCDEGLSKKGCRLQMDEVKDFVTWLEVLRRRQQA